MLLATPAQGILGGGDGGFVTVRSDDEAAKLRELRNHGLVDRDNCGRVGINSRLDTLQAAFLLVKLDTLDGVLERRRENAALYLAELAGVVRLPVDGADLLQTWSAFVVRHPCRDRLIAAWPSAESTPRCTIPKPFIGSQPTRRTLACPSPSK